ncbi:type II toxin-antitoxin system VapC family toxin [Candidatus Woesearchaeota archaeon]|nr:MAG: type II toxin-antitoxin system VapC family toxin [Candidatus Woesearchaeota archaeon]
MKKYVIDTHAWIEFLFATEKGQKVNEIITGVQNRCMTAECTLGELKSWALRNARDFERILAAVESQSEIVPIERDDWLSAAELRHEMRKTRKDFGLIDAVILAKQKEHAGMLVSGDSDFKGLPNVLFLG